MSIEPEDLLSVAREVLKLLGVKSYSDLQLTGAFQSGDVWKVTFSYTPTLSFTKKVGCFSVDVETEEIEGMWLDRVWK